MCTFRTGRFWLSICVQYLGIQTCIFQGNRIETTVFFVYLSNHLKKCFSLYAHACSFMEMAHYDIPAMIYYILDKTGYSQVSYIGHSMGTTGLFAANSMMPELNKKVCFVSTMLILLKKLLFTLHKNMVDEK